MTIRILLAAVVLALGACARAPVEYHYFSPRTADGQACAAQCDTFRRDCRADPSAALQPDAPAAMRSDEATRAAYDECSKRAQEEYEQCVMIGHGRGETSHCGRRSCLVGADGTAPGGTRSVAPPDTAACERVYRRCYEGCGGRIEQRCEAGC